MGAAWQGFQLPLQAATPMGWRLGLTLASPCRVMFILSYLAAITAILLLWFVYPKVFDYSKATQDSLLFMDAMKVGTTPLHVVDAGFLPERLHCAQLKQLSTSTVMEQSMPLGAS